LSDTILKGDHPSTMPAKFSLIWFCCFRGEDLNDLNCNNNYMAINSLTYIFCEIFLSTNFAYFEKKIRIKSSTQKLEVKLSLIQDGCHYYYYY
jgi:hypothetical protein